MPSDEERIFFGQYLQAARLARQISLDQLARETRISPAALLAIDHEDLDRLPPDVFLKGFLRAYAAGVGADGEEAVRRYENFLDRRKVLALREKGPRKDQKGVGLTVSIVLGLLAILILGSLSIYRYASQRPDGDSNPSTGRSAGAELRPLEAARLQPSAGPATEGRSAAAPKYVLSVSAKEDSWIKVVIDNGTPAEHALKAGDRLKMEAQVGFNLLIGNAAGVVLNLDNKMVPVPGKRGEIVNIHLP
jgi:cytoskeletal protein RodZ